MIRRAGLQRLKLAGLLIGGILISGSVAGQQPSDADAVQAANQAFYAALSGGDVAAMQKVWSSDPDITNIGPGSKAVAVGCITRLPECYSNEITSGMRRDPQETRENAAKFYRLVN